MIPFAFGDVPTTLPESATAPIIRKGLGDVFAHVVDLCAQHHVEPQQAVATLHADTGDVHLYDREQFVEWMRTWAKHDGFGGITAYLAAHEGEFVLFVTSRSLLCEIASFSIAKLYELAQRSRGSGASN